MDEVSNVKYPGWVIDRHERRKPKRVSSKSRAKLDQDGKREYVVMKCVYGCATEVEVLHEGFSKHRVQAIEDHLSMCEECPEDERVERKSRGVVTTASLLLSSTESVEQLVPGIHSGCKARFDKIDAECNVIKAESIETKARLSSLESDRDNFKSLLELNTCVFAQGIPLLRGKLPFSDTEQGTLLLTHALIDEPAQPRKRVRLVDDAQLAAGDPNGELERLKEGMARLTAENARLKKELIRLEMLREEDAMAAQVRDNELSRYKSGELPEATRVSNHPTDPHTLRQDLEQTRNPYERTQDFNSVSSNATQTWANMQRRSGATQADDHLEGLG